MYLSKKELKLMEFLLDCASMDAEDDEERKIIKSLENKVSNELKNRNN